MANRVIADCGWEERDQSGPSSRLGSLKGTDSRAPVSLDKAWPPGFLLLALSLWGAGRGYMPAVRHSCACRLELQIPIRC